MNYYTHFEIKLILRSKRLKQVFFLTGYWIIFSYLQLVTGNKLLLDSPTCKLIYYPLLISLPGTYYAQYFSSIEANYINKLLTLPIRLKFILYWKYMLYCAISMVIVLLLLPTLTMGIKPLELFTYYTLGIGPIFFIAFQSSRWTTKKIDLSMSVFMNWQGNSIAQYGLIFLFLSIFLGTIAVTSLILPFDKQPVLYLFLLVFSLIFVVTHRIWLSQLAQNYINHRYKNIIQSDEN